MPRTFRVVNLLGAVTCLASALAVLGSSVFEPAYRAHYQDALWLVVAHAGFYTAVVYAFATSRRDHLARRLAIAKAAGAFLFLTTFPLVGQTWMARTPGRYVYQLFDWGPEARIVLMAYVCLGRGAWNTLNVFVLTRESWMPLRQRAPLLGRLVTMIPVALIVTFVWAFLALARMNALQFSPEAHEVARLVLADVSCEQLRKNAPTSTTDVRQRGERRYEVTIDWSCDDLRVLVRAEDGRLGMAHAARPECCAAPDQAPTAS